MWKSGTPPPNLAFPWPSCMPPGTRHGAWGHTGNMYSCRGFQDACLGDRTWVMTELVPLHILSPHSPRFISPERNHTKRTPHPFHPEIPPPDLAVDLLSFMLAVSQDEIMDRDILCTTIGGSSGGRGARGRSTITKLLVLILKSYRRHGEGRGAWPQC